jgi:hypothetical protein
MEGSGTQVRSKMRTIWVKHGTLNIILHNVYTDTLSAPLPQIFNQFDAFLFTPKNRTPSVVILTKQGH